MSKDGYSRCEHLIWVTCGHCKTDICAECGATQEQAKKGTESE